MPIDVQDPLGIESKTDDPLGIERDDPLGVGRGGPVDPSQVKLDPYQREEFERGKQDPFGARDTQLTEAIGQSLMPHIGTGTTAEQLADATLLPVRAAALPFTVIPKLGEVTEEIAADVGNSPAMLAWAMGAPYNPPYKPGQPIFGIPEFAPPRDPLESYGQAMAKQVAEMATPGNIGFLLAAKGMGEKVGAPKEPLKLDLRDLQRSMKENQIKERPIELPKEDVVPRPTEPPTPVKDLSQYGEKLYRESSIDEALEFIPGNKISRIVTGTDYVATSPELATGQGANKGVKLEFESKGLQGEPHTVKPGSEFVAQQGGGTEIRLGSSRQDASKNLSAITVAKDATGERSGLFTKLLTNLEAQGWSKTVNEDGSTTYRKPLPEQVPTEQAGATEPAPVLYPLEGENVKMRKSAERATESPDIPEPIQERVAEAPESFYKQQSMGKVEDAVAGMDESQLASVPRDSNLYTASRLELAKRMFQRGDNEGGYQVFVGLEKEGTRLGQLINQFKMLAGVNPAQIVTVLDKALTSKGKDPLTQPQRTRLLTLTEKGIEARKQLEAAKDAWTKNPTDENAALAEGMLGKADIADLNVQEFANQFQVQTVPATLKAVMQGNLLTPISEVANIFGNLSFLPFRAGTRAIATGLDLIDSFIRSKPREITVQPMRGTAEAAKGAMRGAAQIPAILKRGTGGAIKGETRAGLHPMRAWVKQFAENPDMPTEGGRLTFADRARLAIEGTVGIPAEVLLRGLGAGDAPFREAARARVIAAELSLQDVPKGQWSFAMKFPELFFDKATLERMQSDWQQAVFQRHSKTLDFMSQWIRGKGDWFDFAVATVAPYKLTPWNIIGETLSYNPLIASLRTAFEAKRGNAREAKINAGKFVVGSMLTAAGYWMYSKGILAPSLDEKDEAQKARLLAGDVLPPNHINITALRRALAGGDPRYKAGDKTVDIFRAGGLAGAMFYMTANIGRDFEKSRGQAGKGDLIASLLKNSTIEQARFGVNQSFLKGVAGLLQAVTEGTADNYAQSYAGSVLSIPLPNTLSALSRATRPYRVDVSDSVLSMLRQRLGVFGYDDYLPLKRDLWGRPIPETPDGSNAILYQFFDVTKSRRIPNDPVALELYRLWRNTADTSVIPSIPGHTVTMGGTTYVLDAAQRSRLAELVGKQRREIVELMVTNPEFQALPDERKIERLNQAYDRGLRLGKRQFAQEYAGKLIVKPERYGFKEPTSTPPP